MQKIRIGFPILGVLLPLLAFAGVAAPVHAQSAEPIALRGQTIIPENSWVYPTVTKLFEHNVATMVEGRSPFWGKKTISRFEAATFTARALMRLQGRLDELNRPAGSQRRAVGVDASDVALIRRLFNEFTPELKVLGVTVASGVKVLDRMEQAAQAAQVAQPFKDVPPTHWAASSVERLRQAGIVVGYPSSTSNSNSPSSGKRTNASGQTGSQ